MDSANIVQMAEGTSMFDTRRTKIETTDFDTFVTFTEVAYYLTLLQVEVDPQQLTVLQIESKTSTHKLRSDRLMPDNHVG